MKRSPIFPKDENGKSNALGYDPQIDFSKFLEEARKHATNVKHEPTMPPSNSFEKTMAVGDSKSKRSWKNSLLFWRKSEKEVDRHERVTTKASNGSSVSNPKFVAVSGPIPKSKNRAGLGQRIGSGPLAGCFTPTRAEETELHYMTLDQQSHPSGVQTFGPIYRVT